jgi:tetratricopeptide (TPR) repeat protein
MKRILSGLFLVFALLAFQGCAATTPPPGSKLLIPLKEANLQAVFEENEGLEVTLEDAKEVRDFYRRGVQQKAKAEKQFQEKNYPEAMKLYQSSNESFSSLLQYVDQDCAEYELFEGTHILFFPNLLVADNYLKMGLILRGMGREGPAERKWKRALSFLRESLRTEPSEWGLAVQQEILNLRPSTNK